MTRKEFKELIDFEIIKPYKDAKGKITLLGKIWCKHYSPELNSIYLIRKKQYYESCGLLRKMFARFIHIKLMRRYGIHIDIGTVIGKGFRIAHPTSIVITKCTIGENFQIYQNCTIGQKFHGSDLRPQIGNNVIMFSGSMIIGNVKICDNVRIGANSLVIKDISIPGDYVGSPAMKINNKGERK